jgi:hypothetical protein
MRRTGDFGAILAIAIGTALGWRATASFFSGDRFDVVTGGRYERERHFERRHGRERRVERRRAEGAVAGVAVGECESPFEIDSGSPTEGRGGAGFRVVGEYTGVARLEPEGLVIDLLEGATTARFEPADVRGVVLGWAQEISGGQWSVTHSAEPIPLGEVREGATLVTGARHVLIPGVGPVELANGWLVVEHVLDAPDAGGTAWTYAHAPRGALAALRNEACLAESLLP